jgi:hypothetical protein
LYKIRDKNDVDILIFKQESHHRIRDKKLELPCEPRVALCDDLKFIFKEKKILSPTQKDLFHFWFNTCFVNRMHLCVPKLDIDRLHRDFKHKEYHKDFSIEFFFSLAPFPETSTPYAVSNDIQQGRDAEDPPSHVSSRDSDEYTDPDFIADLEQEYSRNKK